MLIIVTMIHRQLVIVMIFKVVKQEEQEENFAEG